MARLPRGWTKLKVIGDVEPVQILVNRQSGKFGTSLDGETVHEWETLAAAEAFVKEMNEAGAVNAVMTDSPFGDQVVRLLPVRIKKLNRYWVRMDGTRLPYSTRLYIPDPAAASALEQKQAEHEATRRRLSAIREEAWEVVKAMTLLEGDI